MKRALVAALAAALLLLPVAAGATGPWMVFFDSGSERPNRHASAILDNAILWLRHNRITRVKLVGSADRVGSAAFNLRLSRRRAEVARDELVRRGFPQQSIEVDVRGETSLIDQTGDGVAGDRNRHVLLEVIAAEGETGVD